MGYSYDRSAATTTDAAKSSLLRDLKLDLDRALEAAKELYGVAGSEQRPAVERIYDQLKKLNAEAKKLK